MNWIPFFGPKMAIQEEPVPFGKQFRDKYYIFEKTVTPINHGSFGAVPRPVLDAYYKHVEEDQAYPDRYIRKTIFKKLDQSAQEVADLINADRDSIVFVHNATTAINTVLRSYPFAKGDKILIQSTVYGACGNTVKFLKNRYEIEIVVIQLDYPLEDGEVLEKFETIFKEQNIKLAMFDAVTSMPSVKLPFERIIDLCHKYEVLSLVDGAHSIGLIPLDLGKWKPDFYTSCLHKWLSTPRGCAFLYVDPKHHREIHTLPVSHAYLDDKVVLPPDLEEKRLVDRFSWIGSINYAPFFTASDALKFRREICGGEDKIRGYTNDLAVKASKLVSDQWGTPILQNKEGTLLTSLFSVEAPFDKDLVEKMLDKKFFVKVGPVVEEIMFKTYDTYVPTDMHNGKCYARFSCEVYNELDDYKYAATALLEAFDDFLETDEYKKMVEEYNARHGIESVAKRLSEL